MLSAITPRLLLDKNQGIFTTQSCLGGSLSDRIVAGVAASTEACLAQESSKSRMVTQPSWARTISSFRPPSMRPQPRPGFLYPSPGLHRDAGGRSTMPPSLRQPTDTRELGSLCERTLDTRDWCVASGTVESPPWPRPSLCGGSDANTPKAFPDRSAPRSAPPSRTSA
jgi:hypothetical protein